MKFNKKLLSMLLSAMMMLNMVTPAFAVAAPAANGGKAITQCEHHKVHDADCYTTELVCGLTEESDTSASSSNAAHTHTQDCYKLACPYEAGQHGTACGYTVTAFDALTTEVQMQSVAAKTALDALHLPTELLATGGKTTGLDSGTPSEAVPAAITLTGITWELTAANNDGITAYDEQAEQGSYIFTPVLPEGYILGTGVALPQIYVLVGALNALTDELRVEDSSGNRVQATNDIYTLTRGSYTISGSTTKERIVAAPASGETLDITMNAATIDLSAVSGICAFEVTGKGTTTLTLAQNTTTIIKSGDDEISGISADGKDFTITAQDETGELEVFGGNGIKNGYGGAGISGGSISGGTVRATGGIGDTGGINGGGGGYGISNVTINGGTVSATGGNGGNGGSIGGNGGTGGNAGSGIDGGIIRGGTVTARGGIGGRGGSGGKGGTGGFGGKGSYSITIRGGMVSATGGKGGDGGPAGPGYSGGKGDYGGDGISGGSIIGGTVIATGGSGGDGGPDDFSAGVGGDGGNGVVSGAGICGGSVIAKGGKAGGSGQSSSHGTDGKNTKSIPNGTYAKPYVYTFSGTANESVSNLRDAAGNTLKDYLGYDYGEKDIFTNNKGEIYLWHSNATQSGNEADCNGTKYTSDASGNMTIALYNITVQNGTATPTQAPAGETVSIVAGTAPSDQVFDKWTTTDGVTFAKETAESTTFTMLAKDVTVTATYKVAPATVTAVAVDPKIANVQQGAKQQFNATVTGTNNPPTTVTWTVTGGTKAGTSITDGLLTVAADETAGATLTVTATSTADTTKSDIATVTVTKTPATVTSVTVTPDTANVQQGIKQQFNASVTGTNSPAQTVTWAVTGGITGTSINVDGLLTVAAGETATTLTVTATSTVDNTKSGNATVTVTIPPATKYTLTVTDGTGSGEFEANASVTITANPPATGKVFDKWATADGVTFANATAESTTFTMPAKNITVTATYKDVPPIVMHTITASAGNGGTISPTGNVSVADGANHTFSISANSRYSIFSVIVDGVNQGAISSYTFSNVTGDHTISAEFRYNDSSEDSTIFFDTPTDKEPILPNKSEIKVQATVDNNGNASVTITDKAVADAIKSARWEAKKNGTEKNGISIELNIDTGKQKPDSISVNLPKTVQDTLVREKIVEFTISSELVELTFDNKALQAIQKQAGGDAVINVSRADVSKLSKEAQDEIGNRPVFNLSITGQNGENISDFGGGLVKVSIPYTLQPGEDQNNLQAYFIDAKGKLHEVTCTYDPVTKRLVFVTNHFSVYGIGYNENVPKFNDMENHWAKNDIEFVTARGWLSGTGTNVFSPDGSITRDMFVTALGKLAGTDAGSYKENSFSDGSAALSRQEMAVFMANYAKTTGYAVPKTRMAVTFADNANIASWAAEAVKSMQMAGVIMGKDGNRFDPTGTATRAEASAVLRRYAELVIDKATAQGLDRNDSGKIVYYENGKLFIGTKTIDGTTYHFGDDGICTKIDAVIPDTKK